MGNMFGGGAKNAAAARRQHFVDRLTRFYKYWNPAKLVNSNHVVELLDKYEGREEELLSTLIQKYGKEPPADFDAGDSANSSDKNLPRKDSDEISSALHAALWDKNDEFTGRRRNTGASPALANAVGASSTPPAATNADGKAESASPDSDNQTSPPALPSASADEPAGDDDNVKSADDEVQAVNTDPPSNFLGDTEQDIQERVEFMKKLAELRLPMPQNEGHFHASRIFVDALGKSVYDPEQWIDYLKVKGYKL